MAPRLLLWISLILTLVVAIPSHSFVDGLGRTVGSINAKRALIPREVSKLSCDLPAPGDKHNLPAAGKHGLSIIPHDLLNLSPKLVITTGVSKRAPKRKGAAPGAIPLPNYPGSAGEAEKKCIERYNDATEEKHIGIVPPDALTRDWIVDGIQISLTAEFHEFDPQIKKHQTYVMRGLEGCTAIFIFSPRALWAAHIWENGRTRYIREDKNEQTDEVIGIPPQGVAADEGVGGFLRWVTKGESIERPDEIFKRIAVDIHGERTPQHILDYNSYVSLLDVRERRGNPFGDRNTRVVIMTPAKEKGSALLKYDTKIKLLEEGIKLHLPQLGRSSIVVKTYSPWYDMGLERKNGYVNGVMALEYTPFSSLSANKHMCEKAGQIRVWIEDAMRPACEISFTHGM